ncbi:MAG: hypothetical protein U9Q98_00870 [Bacteroidota bacterium]|nr:hypothetical protein [Bacteroidota bacterium]
MKRLILICYSLVILVFQSATAQQVPEKNPAPLGSSIEPEEVRYFTSDVFDGKVVINQTSELEKLIGLRMAILKKQKGFKGYRIRVFASVGRGARREANQSRVEFAQKHPDCNAYLVYNNPNWEIHVGDYRTRFETKHFLEKIKEEYPKAFIVASVVEFPEL